MNEMELLDLLSQKTMEIYELQQENKKLKLQKKADDYTIKTLQEDFNTLYEKYKRLNNNTRIVQVKTTEQEINELLDTLYGIVDHM